VITFCLALSRSPLEVPAGNAPMASPTPPYSCLVFARDAVGQVVADLRDHISSIGLIFASCSRSLLFELAQCYARCRIPASALSIAFRSRPTVCMNSSTTGWAADKAQDQPQRQPSMPQLDVPRDEPVGGSGLEFGARCHDNILSLVEIRDNAAHFVNKDLYLGRRVLEVGTASLRNTSSSSPSGSKLTGPSTTFPDATLVLSGFRGGT
jgi:hypothetical protein